MIALGILCFLLAGTLVFFALKPDLAFHLDEGWKFKNKVEPSETYVAVNTAGRFVAALVAVGLGIAAITQGISEHREKQDQEDSAARYAASQQRCESDIAPKFNQTIRWTRDGAVANRDEVLALGRELDVDVKIRQDNSLAAMPDPPPPSDTISVHDPSLPGPDKLILFLSGSATARCITPRQG